MKKHQTAFFILVILGNLALGANKFWEKQEYTEWSEKEVLVLMNKSPWSQRVKLRLRNLASLGGDPGYDHRQDMVLDRTTARERLGEQWARDGGVEAVQGSSEAGVGAAAAKPNDVFGTVAEEERRVMSTRRVGIAHPDDTFLLPVTLRWYALPLRHAVIRWEFLRKNKKVHWKTPEHYTIGLSGLPAEMFPSDQERLKAIGERLRLETFLKIKGREPIPCHGLFVKRSEVIDLRAAPWRDAVEVYMMFSREGSNQVTLADKKVEFVTRIGSLQVKRKFKLKDMVYNGKLEL